MVEKPRSKKAIVPLRQRPEVFLKRIMELAEDTRNIKWSAHARERMAERDISIRVALNVMRTGYLNGEITPGKGVGEWRAKIAREVRGRREVGVVVVLVRNGSILVKTVEWEDTK
jgi:hypothetical protein